MSTNNIQTPDGNHHRNYVSPLNTIRRLEAEQKGCKRGCYGTKDNQLLHKAILKNCKREEPNYPQHG